MEALRAAERKVCGQGQWQMFVQVKLKPLFVRLSAD